MAPAGTAFKAPALKALSVTKTATKRDFIMISDDELDAPIYAGGDSSDDDEPSRGDIRPSSFRPKEPKISVTAAVSQLRNRKLVSICLIGFPVLLTTVVLTKDRARGPHLRVL